MCPLVPQFWSIRKLMVVSRRFRLERKIKLFCKPTCGADRQVAEIFLATGSSHGWGRYSREAMRPPTKPVGQDVVAG